MVLIILIGPGSNEEPGYAVKATPVKKENIMDITEDMISEFYIEYDEVKAYEEQADYDTYDELSNAESMAINNSIMQYWSGRMQSLARVKEIFGL